MKRTIDDELNYTLEILGRLAPGTLKERLQDVIAAIELHNPEHPALKQLNRVVEKIDTLNLAIAAAEHDVCIGVVIAGKARGL